MTVSPLRSCLSLGRRAGISTLLMVNSSFHHQQVIAGLCSSSFMGLQRAWAITGLIIYLCSCFIHWFTVWSPPQLQVINTMNIFPFVRSSWIFLSHKEPRPSLPEELGLFPQSHPVRVHVSPTVRAALKSERTRAGSMSCELLGCEREFVSGFRCTRLGKTASTVTCSAAKLSSPA